MNDEQWVQLLKTVADTYNEVTLSRGYGYFKNQYVVSLNIGEDRIVKARVTGTEDYSVTLKLNSLGSSTCTCPVHTNCKHMAAAMMELADRLGYPSAQIMNAKHHLKRLAAETPPPSSSQPKSKYSPAQLPDMDVLGWHRMLDQYTAHLKLSYDPEIYVDLLRNQVRNMDKLGIPFTEKDWVYFDLHRKLFILRRTKQEISSNSSRFFTPYLLYRMYDDMQAGLAAKPITTDLSQPDERLKQTLGYIRMQMAQKETDQKYLDYGLFTALWMHGVAPRPDAPDWAAEELTALEQQISEAGTASLAAAKAFLHLQQADGRQAWDSLEASGTLPQAPPSLFFPFFKLLSEAGDWTNLREWLSKSAPNFYAKNTRELDTYMRYWSELLAHVPETELQLWSVLEGMLPHSKRLIENMLYEQRRWKQWIELQIVQDRDPLYHRVSVFQPIEKEAPELLLPFYHQSIERYVALKNRHDYKLAVKQLKRLEKVYRRMKQPERWDRFLAGFIERYSRLRALQEEMKKGKLLG
jgi:hypothetical protein